MNHRPKRRECAMNTQVYKTQIKYKKKHYYGVGVTHRIGGIEMDASCYLDVGC